MWASEGQSWILQWLWKINHNIYCISVIGECRPIPVCYDMVRQSWVTRRIMGQVFTPGWITSLVVWWNLNWQIWVWALTRLLHCVLDKLLISLTVPLFTKKYRWIQKLLGEGGGPAIKTFISSCNVWIIMTIIPFLSSRFSSSNWAIRLFPPAEAVVEVRALKESHRMMAKQWVIKIIWKPIKLTSNCQEQNLAQILMKISVDETAQNPEFGQHQTH